MSVLTQRDWLDSQDPYLCSHSNCYSLGRELKFFCISWTRSQLYLCTALLIGLLGQMDLVLHNRSYLPIVVKVQPGGQKLHISAAPPWRESRNNSCFSNGRGLGMKLTDWPQGIRGPLWPQKRDRASQVGT